MTAKKEKKPKPRRALTEPTGDDWRYRTSSKNVTIPGTLSNARPVVKHGTKRSEVRIVKFLSVLAMGWSPTAAAVAAGISRITAYEWRKNDPEFAQRWADAIEQGTDCLEDEAVRRANEGVEKPLLFQGDVVALVREHSDTLMTLMLKGRRRKKFGDKVGLVGGDEDDNPIQVAAIHRIIVKMDE